MLVSGAAKKWIDTLHTLEIGWLKRNTAAWGAGVDLGLSVATGGKTITHRLCTQPPQWIADMAQRTGDVNCLVRAVCTNCGHDELILITSICTTSMVDFACLDHAIPIDMLTMEGLNLSPKTQDPVGVFEQLMQHFYVGEGVEIDSDSFRIKFRHIGPVSLPPNEEDDRRMPHVVRLLKQMLRHVQNQPSLLDAYTFKARSPSSPVTREEWNQAAEMIRTERSTEVSP